MRLSPKFLSHPLWLFAGLSVACQTGSILEGLFHDPSAQQTISEVPAASQLSSFARASEFSANQSWQHLQALTDIGPRPVASNGNDRARQYLTEQLEMLGLEAVPEKLKIAMRSSPDSDEDESQPRDAEPAFEIFNLTATIPGTTSDDVLLLAAHFDTQAFDEFEFVGANDGASGAAVLLEIARVVAASPLPYATQFVFLNADSPYVVPGIEEETLEGTGSLGLSIRIQKQGVSRVRLAVFLNRVGDADLRIARDLMSHRIYRQEFWAAARRLGQTSAFQPNSDFETTWNRSKPFIQIGLRRFVFLVDNSFGGNEPPGLYANTDQDTIERCSAESLETVGMVTLEALETISKRLVKIDRFSASPVSEVETLPEADDPAADPENALDEEAGAEF